MNSISLDFDNVVVTAALQGPPGVGGLTSSVDVTPGASYQAQVSQIVNVDCRTGPVSLLTPIAPANDQIFAVLDVWAYSSLNPIIVAAQGVGTTIANPSWSGAGALYVVSAFMAQPSIVVQTWRFHATANQWRFAS